MPKREIADCILDQVVALRAAQSPVAHHAG